MTKLKLNLLALLLVFTGVGNLWAQYQTQNIPIDPSIAYGTLDNGMTYYIKNNPKPENQAEMRLAINVGSVLETDAQQGLAHFLEHMAFNGTTHFEKNELIEYLESLGVRFGADLNAHTSFDETVYKLTLPSDDEEIYDNGLKILKDWSNGITLAEEDIDEERGVIAEELRSGLVGSRRLFNSYVPLITNHARYADRLPIGKMDVIQNFEYEEIRSFYKDWYRPNLMAIIVVGDIDVQETKAKIIETFSDLKNPKNPKERTVYGIPSHKDLMAGVFTDPEVEKVQFYAYYKKDKTVPTTYDHYRDQLINTLYSGMLNQRMAEARDLGVAPVLSMGAGIGNFLADKSSYFVSVSLKENNIKEGVLAGLAESERAKRFGFTQSELDRYKKRLLNSADLRRKEEGKISSRGYVEDYVDHFIQQSPIPGSEFTYNFYKEQLPTISLEEVNAVAEEWITDENINLVLTGPEKEGLELPDEEELVEWFRSVEDMKLEPYEDNLKVDELMSWTPEPGSIVESSYIEEVDITEWKLSNGITVLLKPTTLQNDIITMNGFRSGGSSLASDDNYISARYAGDVVNQTGINNIPNSGLRKLMMGKTVNVRPYINFYDDLIAGTSASGDAETMLQLAHLYFTRPYKDEQIFESYKKNQIETHKDDNLNPLRFFYDEIAKEMSDSHLRATPITAKQVEEELDLDKAIAFYKKTFSNAYGFTFVFVGNFEPETLKPMVETYLASLPAEKYNTGAKDIGLRYTQGNNKTYHKGIEDKADVHLRFTGNFDFSLRDKKLLSALSHVIRLRLYEELREDRGGVYGVRVASFANDIPYNWYRTSIEFTSSPDNVHDLIEAVHVEIEKIKENGVLEEDLKKVKEALRLQGKEGLSYNGYWSSKIKEAYTYDLDYTNIPDYESFVNKLTGEALQELAKKYLIKENYSQFILLPEEK